MLRRLFNGLAPVAAVLALMAPGAHAQATYPTKPVKLVVPFAAGGSTTVMARLLAERLSQSLGQPFVVDNRSGAGGNVGMEVVARSEPDGYTLLMGPIGLAINPSLYKKMSFDPQKDFTPISLYAGVPNLLLVHPAVPARNVSELLDYARANPGKLTYASSGVGTSSHMSAEMLKAATGTFILHIPYRGAAPAMQDLMGGQVQMLFEQMPAGLPAAQGGKVRAIGVTSAKRSLAAPEIPAIGESVKGFEVNVWYGILAPKGTPQPIVARLNTEILKALNDPAFQAQLAKLGATPMGSSPAEFSRFLASETAKWAQVVKSSGAQLD